MPTLQDYLTKITRGAPINYHEFKKKLPGHIRVDHSSYFRSEKLSTGGSQVTVLDQTVFNNLLKVEPQTRIAAADNGDSHQISTSFSHLLIYRDGLLDPRPDLVLIHRQRIIQPFVSKPSLLVIENEENFFCYQAMLPILSIFYGGMLNLSNVDVVWGAGNQINNSLNRRFLNQYDTVLCAFDYDYGGLRMFKTLQDNMVGHTVYLMPTDFTPYITHFNKAPKSAEHWIKALTLADDLGFINLKAAFNRSHNQFMEQESLLSE